MYVCVNPALYVLLSTPYQGTNTCTYFVSSRTVYLFNIHTGAAYIGMDLYASMKAFDGVAHFGHLGGALMGALYFFRVL